MLENKTTEILNNGGVIAYPTEAVFGLGCDPDNPEAIKKLLAVKQRSVDKGLILIADDFEKLRPYVDLSDVAEESLQWMFSHWPGPFTFVIPKSNKTSHWVAGNHNSIAVRVTAHHIAADVVKSFGKPIVSTSANLAGAPSITCSEQLKNEIEPKVDAILEGTLGEQSNPSIIIELTSRKVLRG